MPKGYYSFIIFMGTFIALFSFTSSQKKYAEEGQPGMPFGEYFKVKGHPKVGAEDLEQPKTFLKIYSVNIDGDLYFADERIPLEDFDVRERLDRELHVNTYWHSNTILMMKLANKYFPAIERQLKENGVPDDFKYLVLAESGLRNATSHAGAVGFWQFLKRTAQEYNLEVNSEVDERYHVAKSTVAACKYLNRSYDKFGSWPLAAASYNRGVDGIRRAMTSQKVDNYFDLYLNQETSRYVFRILALKEIFSHPERYGFYLDEKDLYQPLRTGTVEVSEPIQDLADFAARYGTNYKTLKLINPWLKQPYLRNTTGKTYEIEVPLDS